MNSGLLLLGGAHWGKKLHFRTKIKKNQSYIVASFAAK